MRAVWGTLRVARAPVVGAAKRANRWWDTHRALTDLVFLIFVASLATRFWFRWWLVPVLLIGAAALVMWGTEVVRLARRLRRGG
ncbi:hypothetical protein [Streptomyces silvensis]|uniref:hypothetical protein n=1 Tax=Streptomyces silvensis TaxID=1765722 RepID=UPI000A8BE91F|nr:hypothetical protein [Streptomyces silvensis]